MEDAVSEVFITCTDCGRPWLASFAIEHECPGSGIDDASTNISRVSASTGGVKKVVKRTKKATLDLDRHCGVIIIPSGLPCMRSLTCKSHSVASKRAVIGRSKSFDILLAEHLAISRAKTKATSALKESVDATKSKDSLQPSAENIFKSTALTQEYNIRRRSWEQHYSPLFTARPGFWLETNLRQWVVEPLRLFSASRKNAESRTS